MSNLVLARKYNESIVIQDPVSGNVITFKLTNIDRNQVIISFDAPKEVIIDRFEVYQAKKNMYS